MTTKASETWCMVISIPTEIVLYLHCGLAIIKKVACKSTTYRAVSHRQSFRNPSHCVWIKVHDWGKDKQSPKMGCDVNGVIAMICSPKTFPSFLF